MATAEDVFDGEEHRVVEKTGDVLLIRANIARVTIEGLADLEDSRGVTVLLPEVFGHMWDCVNTDAIEAICFYEVMNPFLKVTTNEIILLREVGQAGKAAMLHLPLITPVLDVALVMVVLRLIERVDLLEVSADAPNVVGNHVDHDVNILCMGSLDKALKILLGAKMVIDFLPIASGIAMIVSIHIVGDG